jgi:hypothetical protein
MQQSPPAPVQLTGLGGAGLGVPLGGGFREVVDV